MSQVEVNKTEIFNLLEKGKITRGEAARSLELSLRQVDRLRKRLEQEGLTALIHRNRGKSSNRSLKMEFKAKVIGRIKERYLGFGPTLAAEKLRQNDNLIISRERLRLLMHEEGLWKGKRRKQRGYHPRRPRRSCFGELIQGDGSHHDWFEGRGPRCVLIGLIDDATNTAYGMFHESETIEAYVGTFKKYLEKYGRPLALYVDKDSIFRINRQIISRITEGETQFGRMMKELGIQLICAHSPEAKGRIERLFGTLQDRLVKEMRLLNLDNIEEANLYLENEYWDEFNKRWSGKPEREENAHRSCPADEALNRIFTLREKRKVSKSLDFSYRDVLFQIKTKTPNRFVKQQITICERFDGTFWAEQDGKKLDISEIQKMQRETPIQDSKTINAFLNKSKPLSYIGRRRKGMRTPR